MASRDALPNEDREGWSEGMTIPEQLTQFAVGSSTFIWAVDTDSNTVWRRNLITQDFECVESSIIVASLDASADGDLIALDPAGNLHPGRGRPAP